MNKIIIKSELIVEYFFFFFKQKTAYEIYQCDWSSDVCSSDLLVIEDEMIMRVTIEDSLKADGYKVSAFERGEDGKIGRASCRERV